MVSQLPTEILHLILSFALPKKPTYATYGARYRWLLAYSLVNSTWHGLAQLQLYKYLFVRSSRDLASGLLARAQKLGGGRHLHLGAPCFGEYEDGWLPSLEGVKEVTLTDMRLTGGDLMRLEGECSVGSLWHGLGDLTLSLADVETLHLHHCELHDIPFRAQDFEPPFPHLHTLSLLDIRLSTTVFHSWAEWFTPVAFPRLRHLSLLLLSSYDDPEDDPQGLTSSLKRQLESLSVTSDNRSHVLPWQTFTSLKRLSLYPCILEPMELLHTPLRSVPAGLSLVRIGHPSAGDLRELARRGTALSVKVHPEDLAMEAEAQDWDRQVLNALLETLVENRPILRDVKLLQVEGCAFGLGLGDALEETITATEVSMKERGGEFIRQVGWLGGASHCDWERYIQTESVSVSLTRL